MKFLLYSALIVAVSGLCSDGLLGSIQDNGNVKCDRYRREKAFNQCLSGFNAGAAASCLMDYPSDCGTLASDDTLKTKKAIHCRQFAKDLPRPVVYNACMDGFTSGIEAACTQSKIVPMTAEEIAAAAAERSRIAREAEAKQAEAEKIERERQANEENARLERESAERERVEREQRESVERAERERVERERVESVRIESERIAAQLAAEQSAKAAETVTAEAPKEEVFASAE